MGVGKERLGRSPQSSSNSEAREPDILPYEVQSFGLLLMERSLKMPASRGGNKAVSDLANEGIWGAQEGCLEPPTPVQGLASRSCPQLRRRTVADRQGKTCRQCTCRTHIIILILPKYFNYMDLVH